MTLLFVNTLYYPNHLGGAEVSVQLLCEALYKLGHKVYILSQGDKRNVTRHNGVITIYLPFKNFYPVIRPSTRFWVKALWHVVDTLNFGYYFLMRRLIRRIQPQVVNTNNMQGFSLLTWRALAGKQHVLLHTMRDYYILCHRTTLYKNGCQCGQLCTSCSAAFAVKKHTCKVPDAFIGISSHILNRHLQHGVGEQKITAVVPNIITSPNVQDSNRVPEAGNIRIGFIGRLTPEKGIPFLFEELSRLKQGNYTLVLAGAYEPQYQQMLTLQYPLKGKVVFMGKTDPEVFYRDVDMVVVPSAWEEPFGRVAIEALAYNKPVCIAARGGLTDLYEPECMWQFYMRSGSLTSVLEEVLQNPHSITHKAAQCSRFMYKYSEETVAAQFMATVQETIKKKLK
ncbi:glycosyltransferase involved in cell wall biosynthesis [Filimonas zeae]|uniref:Glycosyl transferase n=1 Tax=Filimonas zeae TaxID=1737353 RepID=A0A917J5T5_9BACT|nr:glycosyltransferase family 4 protein [Filimonas zeae]MDR6341780.1 glycosyltransferase involved in cell wall biosynthesis [Filimonas zeae]GGH80359.1 glycosyl transferase [Filimonas zeae]